LLFAYPQLDDKRLAEAYGLHYYPASGKGNIAVYENTPVGILRQTFDRVEAELGPLSEKKLLDFGCGVGRLCQVAGEHGISAVGIEFDAQARATASKAANLRVYATLDELRATEGDPQFDIVTMWDVIEHLREPWKELGLLSSLLQHNGWLLLSTPNAECLKALLQRKRWEDIVNPTHFYYFTRRSLKLVLERAGFCEISELQFYVRYPGHSTIRRILHRALTASQLQGQLVYVARLGTIKTFGASMNFGSRGAARG
jgi:SAM-dependent methyltransferase